jgi:hypothetical protein
LLSYALTQLGLIEGEADCKPADGLITAGEWLGYAANVVPHFLESGSVKTDRGAIPIGEPLHYVRSAQISAVFDFSKSDTFILQ